MEDSMVHLNQNEQKIIMSIYNSKGKFIVEDTPLIFSFFQHGNSVYCMVLDINKPLACFVIKDYQITNTLSLGLEGRRRINENVIDIRGKIYSIAKLRCLLKRLLSKKVYEFT